MFGFTDRGPCYFFGGGCGSGGSGNADLGGTTGGNSANCLAISGGILPPASVSNLAAKRSRGANFNAAKKLAFASFGMGDHHVMETEQKTPFGRLRPRVDVLFQPAQLIRVRLDVAVEGVHRVPVGQFAQAT